MARWSTEIRNDRAVFEELAPWWDAQPAPSTIPFLRTRVIECWLDAFMQPDDQLHVMLLRRDGDLVAALPMKRNGLRLRTLSNGLTARYDVVAVDDDEVLHRVPRWLDSLPVAHLYRIQSESIIVDAVSDRRRWIVRYARDSPYLDLTRGMDGIRAGWSGDFRRTLGRRRRRLEELGEVTFVTYPGDGDHREIFEAGLGLEAAGWKGREGVAVLKDPSYERWYRGLVEIARDEGWLRLSSLYLGDRLIAFGLGMVYGGRRYGMLTTYDEAPDVAKLSVGNLMFESILENACAEGLASFELGPDYVSYKRDWTPHHHMVYDLSIYGSRPMGRLIHALQRGRAR